ncbi:MAG: hypothetical protein ACJ8C4_13320 [Gemmataceae bacterium]
MADFVQVSRLAQAPLVPEQWQIEFLDAPHRAPKRLPSGKIAIYGFWGNNAWLKIGLAGAKTKARYTSQHYNPGSARSTLAASLTKCPDMQTVSGFDSGRPGDWIKGSCHRVNILLDAKVGRPLLALLEAFLHVRLNPRHER